MGNEECMCRPYMNDGPKLHLLCRKIDAYWNNMLVTTPVSQVKVFMQKCFTICAFQ